jgi:hypothetical protein
MNINRELPTAGYFFTSANHQDWKTQTGYRPLVHTVMPAEGTV